MFYSQVNILADPYFSERLRLHTMISRGEVLLMCLTLGMRYCLSWVAIIDLLKLINIIFGKKILPETKHTLHKYFPADMGSAIHHLYCSGCKKYFGERNKVGDRVECSCGVTCVTRETTTFFLELDFESQLKNLLKNPTVVNNLGYRFGRKCTEGVLQDIYDGKMYTKLSQNDGLLSKKWNFSYTFNTDGCQAADSSKVTIWPIYAMLHELPPSMRSKHMILVGLWIDKTEPIMNVFLKPFVKQANRLSSTGFIWQLNENEEIVSKAIPLLCSVDSVARAAILNMKQFNGTFGCTFCEHPTEGVNSQRKYTVSVHVPHHRSDESIKQNMIKTLYSDNGVAIKGVWGPSILMNLNFFDLVDGMDVDYMHCVLLGVTRQYTELILSTTNANFYVGDPNSIGIINKRLLSITPPKCITRTPRSINERRLWKASEWRSWLIFYSLVCLKGVLLPTYLKHLALLVTAVNIFLQESITPCTLQSAEKMLIRFVVDFQKLFGIQAMTYNVHLLLHLTDSVRNWGPLWVHSSFPFENQNRFLLQMKKSPTRIITQIVQRLLFYQSMSVITDQIVISNNVHTFCAKTSKHRLLYFSKFDECTLIGCGKDYVLNAEEIVSIGYPVIRCKVYKKMIYDGIRYTISTYERNKKANDSIVELKNNEFGIIHKILKVYDGAIEKVVILIHKVDLERDRPYLSTNHVKVTHITRCYICQDGNLCACGIACLKNPSILMEINNAYYLCRIPKGCFGD